MSPQYFKQDKRAYGFWQAVRRLFRRRAELLAFLLLAAVCIYNFAIERQHSDQNRAAVAAQTSELLKRGCERSNAVRLALQHIFADNLTLIARQHKTGKLNDKDYAFDVKFIRKEAARLTPTNCDAASQLT